MSKLTPEQRIAEQIDLGWREQLDYIVIARNILQALAEPEDEKCKSQWACSPEHPCRDCLAKANTAEDESELLSDDNHPNCPTGYSNTEPEDELCPECGALLNHDGSVWYKCKCNTEPEDELAMYKSDLLRIQQKLRAYEFGEHDNQIALRKIEEFRDDRHNLDIDQLGRKLIYWTCEWIIDWLQQEDK